MKKVKIEPGCISCGTCQFICPQVFEVTDRSRIKKGVDAQKYAEKIEEAVAACPVQVIKFEKKEE